MINGILSTIRRRIDADRVDFAENVKIS